MPYTLMKGLVWFALALLIGIAIGWLMRNVTARRQVARARNHHVDGAELERLRGRVSNLEGVVAERDQLRAELAACRNPDVASPSPTESDTSPSPPTVAPVAGLAHGATLDDPASRDAPDTSPSTDTPAGLPSTPDVLAAAAVLGHTVTLDDLKVVEGIGPKIELLCNGIGIRTWFDLATTEVSLLRTMLADAGPRFRTHDPGTWPEQARLLAEGRWHEFQQLVDELAGGRPVSAGNASSSGSVIDEVDDAGTIG